MVGWLFSKLVMVGWLKYKWIYLHLFSKGVEMSGNSWENIYSEVLSKPAV